MAAVGFHAYGGPDAVRLVEVPVPEPGPGEVRVRVRMTTVNPADVQYRRGDHAAFVPDALPPFVGGLELVGTVDAVGEGVDLLPGATVAGSSHFIPGGRGSHAELVVTGAGAVAPCPAGVDEVALATVPMNGLTARVVLDTLALPPGATVVVTGAAGAVGGYVVELASAAGLEVVAVASSTDEELVVGLGATAFVPRGDDVAQEVRARHPDGVDAVVDAAMLDAAALPMVRDGGRLLTLRPGHVPPPERGIEPRLVSFRRYQDRPDVLADLLALSASGGLTTRVAEVLTPHRGAEAHALAETPGLRGRVVLAFDA
ncbi:NADP-dependent oxidoreductase [Nocardioides cavernae]|nr:NADP-dependent oxidoreductase [Nocardioides cavernae]